MSAIRFKAASPLNFQKTLLTTHDGEYMGSLSYKKLHRNTTGFTIGIHTPCMNYTHSLDRTENQQAEATKVGPLRDLVVAFGLQVEFEQGKFTCPITGECLTWDTLGRMQIDGESVTLFSVHARIGGKRRSAIK